MLRAGSMFLLPTQVSLVILPVVLYNMKAVGGLLPVPDDVVVMDPLSHDDKHALDEAVKRRVGEDFAKRMQARPPVAKQKGKQPRQPQKPNEKVRSSTTVLCRLVGKDLTHVQHITCSLCPAV